MTSTDCRQASAASRGGNEQRLSVISAYGQHAVTCSVGLTCFSGTAPALVPPGGWPPEWARPCPQSELWLRGTQRSSVLWQRPILPRGPDPPPGIQSTPAHAQRMSRRVRACQTCGAGLSASAPCRIVPQVLGRQQHCPLQPAHVGAAMPTVVMCRM